MAEAATVFEIDPIFVFENDPIFVFENDPIFVFQNDPPPSSTPHSAGVTCFIRRFALNAHTTLQPSTALENRLD